MSEAGGWLARVARKFGELVGGREGGPAIMSDTGVGDSLSDLERVDAGASAPAASGFWEPHRKAPTDLADAAMGRTPAASGTGRAGDSAEDIRPDASGRYVVAGLSFSSAAQALEYRDRIERRKVTAEDSGSQQPTRATNPGIRSVSPLGWARPIDPAPRWVGTRSELVAGRQAFQADMVYFGTPQRYEGRHDHSRIDPALPVDARAIGADALLDYWPSYFGLKPQSRWRYLEWLSGGRTDPSVPIGYVFVFFYGLEQRLLVDDARDEAEAIFAEVRRLLKLHGEQHSFRSYAARLLALSVFYEDQTDAPPTADCAINYDLELPLDLRVRLGTKLRDGAPFDADDALRWVLALPDVYLRTPGQRCFDELRALWNVRFANRYPAGLSVRRPRSLVKQEYRAASGKFTTTISVDELPDISGTSAPLGPLRAMLDACMEELSAYSRLLGRDPDARGSPSADLLLPAELRLDRPSLAACREALSKLCGNEPRGLATVGDLAELLDVNVGAAGAKLSVAASRQIGMALDALDYGFEPDRRYGPAAAPNRDARISLFAAPNGAPVDPERPVYLEARGIVEVAVLAAAADGEVAAVEIEAIERRLRGITDLADHEIVRLLAHGRALAADPPKVRAALKRLADLPPGRRAALAGAAVEAVLADGQVQPAEVKFLEALHAAMGLSASLLYSALHRGDVGEADGGPVTVAEGSAHRTLPLSDEARPSGTVPIDVARLKRIRGETNRVSELLATIFVEDEPELAVPVASPVSAEPTAFAGLDAAHSALLQRLVAAPMDRDEFEAVASGLRLMADGAIETLNEWGFERFDEPIVEEDGDVRIADEVADRLMHMGVVA